MITLQQADAIEAAVRSASSATIELVDPGYKIVDISVLGRSIRCTEYCGTMFVNGPFLVSFSMPIPQWFRDALAGGAYQSESTRQTWERDLRHRAVEASANRDPEGIDADAADRM